MRSSGLYHAQTCAASTVQPGLTQSGPAVAVVPLSQQRDPQIEPCHFEGRIGGRVIHLNVKRVRGGRVSTALGTELATQRTRTKVALAQVTSARDLVNVHVQQHGYADTPRPH